jgi:hypothetical protein
VVERIRLGVDRDEDGVFDRDELDGGTDPKDAASAAFPRGDMNLDHVVDVVDLPAFVSVLVDPDNAIPLQLTQADVNFDGHADGLDVQALLNLILALPLEPELTSDSSPVSMPRKANRGASRGQFLDFSRKYTTS